MTGKISPEVHRAALSLLSRGLGSPGDVAKVAGVSRQVVEIWVKIARTDWKGVKRRNLEKAWRIALGKEKPEHATKQKLRCQGEAAKVEWDKQHGSNELCQSEREPASKPVVAG